VIFRPILTNGLALLIEPILAVWEDMSKEKLDRAIPSMRPPVVKPLFRLRHALLLQLSIELAPFLNGSPLFASNELQSMLALFPGQLILL
jgi:hypothetical protein